MIEGYALNKVALKFRFGSLLVDLSAAAYGEGSTEVICLYAPSQSAAVARIGGLGGSGVFYRWRHGQ
jgi:hypothetical protein